MTELRVHGISLQSGPRELRVHHISLVSQAPPVQRELRVHSISLTSGPAPGIGDGGIWMTFDGQLVLHRAHFYSGGEWT